MDLLEFDQEYRDGGVELLCGVDEAGRGPLAGPVCAAAVILPPDVELPGLNDSKKLTDKKRRELYDLITERALAWSVALVDEKTIDEINILQATFQAMAQAVTQLSAVPDLVLVDGNREPDLPMKTQCVVGGDGKSASIAAASVLAKVTRDRLMEELDKQYPQYGFAIHKGYGTRRHYDALNTYGPCPIHRMSFLKKWHGRQSD